MARRKRQEETETKTLKLADAEPVQVPVPADPAAAPEATADPETNAQSGQANEEHELLADIRRAEASVSLAEAEMEEAKDVYKSKKNRFDEAVADLRRVIKADNEMPLFKGGQSGQATKAPVSAEAWRDVTLKFLHDMEGGLKNSTVNTLAKNNIYTLGELEDKRAEASSKGFIPWYKNFKGIGEVAGEEIDNVVTAYFAQNPRTPDEALASTTTEPDPATEPDETSDLEDPDDPPSI